MPASATDILSVDRLKRECRYTDTDQDTLFGELIASAVDFVEIRTGLALITRTDQVLDCDAPASREAVLILPRRDVIAVSRIAYVPSGADASAGASTTISGPGNLALGHYGNRSAGRVTIAAPQGGWPAYASGEPWSVTANLEAYANVPPGLVQAIAWVAGKHFSGLAIDEQYLRIMLEPYAAPVLG